MKLKPVPYLKSRAFVLSPYIGVIVGLYILHNAFWAVLIYHAGMLLSLFIQKNDYRTKDLFTIKSKLLLIIASLICLSAGVVLRFVWIYIKPPGFDVVQTMAGFGLSGINRLFFLIYFTLIHPFLEESYWRFHLPSPGSLFSFDELFFALYHTLVLRLFLKMWVVLICFVGLFFIAAGWRYLKEKRGDTFVILLSHALADFSIMLSVFLLN